MPAPKRRRETSDEDDIDQSLPNTPRFGNGDNSNDNGLSQTV